MEHTCHYSGEPLVRSCKEWLDIACYESACVYSDGYSCHCDSNIEAWQIWVNAQKAMAQA